MESIVILILAFVAYFLPSIIAIDIREHQSRKAIFVVNLFLGWTLLGWIVALAWSLTNPTQEVINSQPTQSAADEIQKLANLKEQGLLTDDEFNKKKSEILNNV